MEVEEFLKEDQKVLTIKEIINKFNHIKIKYYCSLKDLPKKGKYKPQRKDVKKTYNQSRFSSHYIERTPKNQQEKSNP